MYWWLERFERFGRELHDLTRDSVLTAHEEHTDAQAQISAPHHRVYGSINSSAQYLFTEGLKKHSEVLFLPPKPRAPKLPIVNGRVVVLWRYANREGIDVFLKKFATSGSRVATFDMAVRASQPSLGSEVDINMNLTEEDEQFLETVKSATVAESVPESRYPVVVVAYASNAAGIYQAVGADAYLQDDGTLKLMNLHRMDGFRQETPKVPAGDTSKRFDLAPRKPLTLESKTGNDE